MKNAKYFSQTMTKRLQEDGLYIPNIPYNDIKNAILKKHHPIKEFFFSGVGLELMYVDSCVTEYIIKKFKNFKTYYRYRM